MKLNYRNSKNADAIAAYWNKPLNKPDWYSVNALADDTAEIFIYDVIGWPYNDVGGLVRTMAGMKDIPILARINSPGGDYFDGISLANAFSNHPAGVTTRVESLAASIASVLAVSGKTVEAYRNTMMMIHNAWVIAIIDENSALELADLLKKIDGNILDSYTGKTKTGKKEMKQMMDDETWMTAQEAKDKGFIDTILTAGKPVKAEFDLSVFAHVPDGFKTDGNHEPTIRDLEKALRDAGLSKNNAKAVLAGGWKAGNAEEEVKAELQKTLSILGGK
jgi:ATP-dependent Clp protease, protease subunit